MAADELVPRLVRRLAGIDVARQRSAMSAGAVVCALAELGDPAAVDVITDFAGAAVRHEQWSTAAAALDALASFGTEAAPAVGVVRPLADAPDVHVRALATAVLWALERDPADVVPRLERLLDSDRDDEAIDVLGRIGPPARAVLPRLRAMSRDGHGWARVHAAAALWDITGETEADLVVHTLSAAWAKNDATSNQVLACLKRMGPAAAPVLPRESNGVPGTCIAQSALQLRTRGRRSVAPGPRETVDRPAFCGGSCTRGETRCCETPKLVVGGVVIGCSPLGTASCTPPVPRTRRVWADVPGRASAGALVRVLSVPCGSMTPGGPGRGRGGR
ncbi:hypothetical protein OG948_37990 (plasmid) [Embleya sp. NBC_00888]|uniref:HEAT repeat domain-containing protein n=1 Tax=Embleya sp. NBC_00888 TaxID=2975960 RepID=UPI002F919500|nr:hypothetical protein OG948_37990 [Embleya sp. NBC_00888]